MVVGVRVLGNTHKPEQACGDLAPLDPGMPADGEHSVTTAAGSSVAVPNDPQRVVVVGGAPLDTLCALGLQDRVVALTPSGDPELTPRYLGRWVSDLPAAGADGVADLDAIRALEPDVIIAGESLAGRTESELAVMRREHIGIVFHPQIANGIRHHAHAQIIQCKQHGKRWVHAGRRKNYSFWRLRRADEHALTNTHLSNLDAIRQLTCTEQFVTRTRTPAGFKAQR